MPTTPSRGEAESLAAAVTAASSPSQRPGGEPSQTLERRTLEIGRDIFARARASPGPGLVGGLLNRLLELATADQRRKVELFRLVDVLPVLESDQQVARHVGEYLLDSGALPAALAAMLRAGMATRMTRTLLARTVRRSVELQARQFVAGRNAQEVGATLDRLRDAGVGFTLDLLGEATTSDARADEYAARCLELLRGAAATVQSWSDNPRLGEGRPGGSPRVNLSVKPSSFDPNFDAIAGRRAADRLLTRLRPVLAEARRLGAFVNIDMERHKHRDLTLAAFRTVLEEPEFRDWPHVGFVLQAYLVDSPAVLEEMLDWVRARGTPVGVRLVKGAYWDVETIHAIDQGWPVPVLTRKWESDAQFEALARRLLDYRDLVRPAFASHNVRSLAVAIAWAESIGARVDEYEIQMLYGMGDVLRQAVAGMGLGVRVYMPCGELIPGMSYLIRRLLENTSNESFLKQGFREKRPAEQLLANPAVARPPSPPLPSPVRADPQENAMVDFESQPLTDFARGGSRERMAAAIAQIAGECRTWPLVIGGHQIHTEKLVPTHNPSEVSQVLGQCC